MKTQNNRMKRGMLWVDFYIKKMQPFFKGNDTCIKDVTNENIYLVPHVQNIKGYRMHYSECNLDHELFL